MGRSVAAAAESSLASGLAGRCQYVAAALQRYLDATGKRLIAEESEVDL